MEHTEKKIIDEAAEKALAILEKKKQEKKKTLEKIARDFHVSNTKKLTEVEEKRSKKQKELDRVKELEVRLSKNTETRKTIKDTGKRIRQEIIEKGAQAIFSDKKSVREVFQNPIVSLKNVNEETKNIKRKKVSLEKEIAPTVELLSKEISVEEEEIGKESEFFKKSEAEPFLNEVIIREELKKQFMETRRSINISEFASPEDGFYQALTVVNELENIAKKKRIDPSFIPETAREILHEKIETSIEVEKAKTYFERRKEGVEDLSGLNNRYEEYTKQITNAIKRRHEVFEELKPILENNSRIRGAISSYGIRMYFDDSEKQEEFLQYFAMRGDKEYLPENIRQTINIHLNGGVAKFIQKGELPIVEKNLKHYVDTLNKSIEMMRELVISYADYKPKDRERKIDEELDRIHKELYKHYYLTNVDRIDPTLLDFVRQKAGGDAYNAKKLIQQEETVYEAKKLDLEVKADAFIDKAVAMNKERTLVSGSTLKFQKEQLEKKKQEVREFEKVLEEIRKQYSEHLDQPLNSYMRFYEDDINIKNWSEQIELLDKKEKQIDLELNTLIQRGEPSFFGVEKYKNKKEGLETKKQTTEHEIKEIIKKREDSKKRSKDFQNTLTRFEYADFKKEFDKKMGFYDLYSNTPGPTLREYVNEGDKYVRGILEESFGAEKEQVLYALQDAEERIKALYTPKN